MNGGILDCGSGKFSVKNLSQFIAANEKKFFTAEKKSQQNSPAKNPRKNSADKIQRNKIGAENSAEEIRRNKIDAENSAEEIQRNEIDAENSADEIQRNKIGVENSAEEIQNSFLLYTPVFEKHSRASLKIQDGCNNSCSFCRVHLARGKSVSLDAKKILERVTELEKIGVNEVVLTGVNLSQYDCRVNGKNFSFAELLEFLLHETQKIKFRISSFYPQHVTEKLCAVLRNERIQPFFHLSIQSGSEKILSLMNRPYKISQVENAVELLRGCKKNPFISCDIIAGFPGETEADFCRTKNLCEKNSFAWIHAFPFSPRKGTPAASMKNQVPERTKNGRVKWLTEKAVQGKISYIKNFSGETLEAVVENLRDESKNSFGEFTFRAVTGNFLHAEFLSEKNFKPGSTVHLKIKNPLEENIRSGKETECSAEICIG
jgi:threonylcarbamoyladenosine tRNA methylthiotransferase MtaB